MSKVESANLGDFYHVNFNVLDMDAMINFYEKGLGYKKCFDTVFKTEETERHLVLLSTGSVFRFEFLKHIKPDGKDSEIPAPEAKGFNHIGLPVKDIEKSMDDLKKVGMKWETEKPIDLPNAKIRIVFGRDIEGNRVELLQKTE